MRDEPWSPPHAHAEVATGDAGPAERPELSRVLVGTDAKALDLLVRVTGSGYQRLVAAVTSRQGPDTQ